MLYHGIPSSYNFVLNEAHNDFTQVANTMLNETPNSNDATCKANNVHLTIMGAQQFSMVGI